MTAHSVFDRPIAYHRVFVHLTGSVTAAVMLSQAVYWQRRAGGIGGNFWKTQDEWEDETGLTRYEQETARRKLRECLPDIWLEERRGVPAKLYFTVKLAELESAALKYAGIPHTGMLETSNQDAANPALSLTETTSETTSENKDPEPRPAASDTSFETFWQTYPRKVGKGKAEERWKKLRPSKTLVREILAAVAAQSVAGAQLDLASRTSNSGECFVPHPATWLGQKRWTDPPEILKGQETDAQRKNREYIAKMLAKERG